MAKRRRRPVKRSSQNHFIGILSIALLLVVMGKSGMLDKAGNVLGVRFLAQETTMTPEQQQMMQQTQQSDQPPMTEQPQSMPQGTTQVYQQMTPEQMQAQQQQFQQMTDEQRRQYGIQQMTPEQQEQNRQYEQMTPEQQQQYNKKINEQIQQKYGGQPGSQTPQQGQPPTKEQQDAAAKQTQQQYQQYQQMTPEQKQEFAQKMQQQWREQATKNGFTITTPPPPTLAQQGQGGTNVLPLSSFPSIQGQFFVNSANGAPNINLNDKNTNIVLSNDSSFKAKKADGTEFTINKEELEKINAAIKLETGSEIAKTGDFFVMKRGLVQAETKFPISFNIATKIFTVETSSGQKEVTVLPDEAVEKAIQNGAITSVAGGTEEENSKVQLTEYQNQPVYQVEGTMQQKMFGFFPVPITKTAVVSAENGNVVTTNQTIFSRLLDTFSF